MLFNLETTRGRDAYADVKFGSITQWSVGFNAEPNDLEVVKEGNQSITNIKNVQLVEVSAVIRGSSPGTGTLSVKAQKEKSSDRMTWCFVGDMTSLTGSFSECLRYAKAYDLPIKFIIEDNDKSVCTDTKDTWNAEKHPYDGINDDYIYYYKYKTKWPHAGAGQRVQF